LVEGGGDGLAGGVGADPGELVRFGGQDRLLKLGDQVGGCVEGDAVGLGEAADQPAVGFDAAGFDEFESVLGPAQDLSGLLAAEFGLEAEGMEGSAPLAASAAADGG